MERKFAPTSSDLLSEKIAQKSKSLLKERHEMDAVKSVWVDELQSIARQKYPKAMLALIGSSANMFGFKHSDCDLILIPGEGFINPLQALDNIEKMLPKFKYRTELVRGAKVPILKIKDKESFLEADINFERVLNLRHTCLLRCYALLDPRVLPLGLVIKLWAKNAGIINQRDHKLSGFTLLLLYIYYLQAGCSPPVVPLLQVDYPSLFSSSLQPTELLNQLKTEALPRELKNFQSANKQSLGELLVGFFRFYDEFNWASKVVCISKSNGYVSNRRPHMKIEDPYDIHGNCARGIYEWSSFQQIKQAFKSALRKLEGGMDLDSIL